MEPPFPGYDPEIVAARLGRWPLFDPALYLHLNGDVRHYGSSASDHFARFGCWEMRPFSTELRLAAGLALVGKPTGGETVADSAVLSSALLSKADIGIYVSSRGNFFMREMAHLLGDGLRELGLRVVVGDERSSPDRRRRHSIIVAPHEFFILGRGASWARHDVVSSCVMLSTEQPQTSWFRASLPYLFSSKGILEMCWQTGQLFAESGMQSCFYMPGLPQAWTANLSEAERVRTNTLIQSLPQAALDLGRDDTALWQRPIDVAFMASESLIRNDFLSRHAASLRDLQSLVIYRRDTGAVPPAYADQDEMTEVNDFILRRTKILLNIHRDSIGYFEAHRLAMQGFWNLCAVVTNRCLPHPYFQPNEHFLEETHDRIPKLMRWLIRTPEGRREAEAVRWRALQRCAGIGSARQQGYRVVEFLDRCYGIDGAHA